MSFLMSGQVKKQAQKQEEAAIEKAKEERGKMYRFYIKSGDPEASITFVDGNLDDEGILDIPMYREHRLFRNGTWNNLYICTSGIEPCPICADGEKADLVGIMTVIDHRTIQSKDGTKVYKDVPRLFVAKRTTLKLLQAMAVKRGGLAGCTFGVTRTEDKQPSVGGVFDFEQKRPVEELRKLFTYKDDQGVVHTNFKPADYEKELVYRDAATLIKEHGFGKGVSKVGGELPINFDAPHQSPIHSSTTGVDYSDML